MHATNHTGQLSLAIPPRVGAMSTVWKLGREEALRAMH